MVLKEYHDVMAVILEVNNQTQEEAALELGISVGHFNQLYRLKRYPNFRTKRGQEFAERVRNWSGIAAGLVFPEGFSDREFLARPKTHMVTVPLSRFIEMKKGPTLEIPMSFTPVEPQIDHPTANTLTKSRKKKRKDK